MPRADVTTASYVPALVARQFTRDSAPPSEARAETLTGAMLFADISGFTALADTLARRGAAGTEELTHCLNVYFGQLIDLITEQGGDVLKFAGDALLALWPEGEDDLATAVARATRCALAAQSRLDDFPAAADVRLSLRIGIGAGPVSLFHVGGVDGRWEIVATGAALTQMSAAKEQDRPGDVTVSQEAWALIRRRADGEPFPGGAVCVRALNDPLPPAPVFPPPPAHAPALLSYVPLTVVHHLLSGQSSWLAELRPVSVLFVNFPGLTPLTPLDRSQGVMRDLQTILHRYEAIINKLSVDDKGASLVAALGLPPLAHEDDPVRAVSAALAMREHLLAMNVRHAIGIATGLTFCGVVGNDVRREYTMMGDVVNLAARLMQAAPDNVLCDQATYEASRSRLALEPLPPIHVKGKSAPINVYRPHAGPPREAAPRSERVAALVGRLAERQAIDQAIRALAEDGTGATLVLEGEAGIGKSRLIEGATAHARERGVTVLVASADAMEKSTAYYPWRAVLFQLFELQPGATKDQRTAGALAAVTGTGRRDWVALLPLLNPVLLTDFADTTVTASLTDRDRALATQDFLAALLTSLPHAEQPKTLVIEDAHWMDSASWKVALRVSLRPAPLLVVLSVRPVAPAALEDLEALAAAPGARRIRLRPLSTDEAIDVARQVLGVGRLPEPVEHVIRTKAEGNPLFIEELVRTLLDARLIQIVDGECRVAPAAGDLRSVDLPETMQAAVVARIDRLSPSQRMLLKVASVVGRVFEPEVLERLYPDARAEAIAGDLGALSAMQITALERSDPAPLYAFSQQIFREVNYNLMLFSQRRQLHRAMAEWLERTHHAQLDAVYPLLAFHWSKAIDDSAPDSAIVMKAVNYLQKAGEQAVRQFANTEAVTFFGDALRLLGTLPETPDRDRHELAICCAIGVPLLATKGFAAPETEQAYARAWDLCKKREDTPEHFGTVLGLWGFYLVKTELPRARELAEELVRLAKASGNPELLLPAHRVMGETAFWLGDHAAARDHLERGMVLYRPEVHHRESVARNGQDPGVVCRGVSAWSLWLLGYPDEAIARVEDALVLARQLSHPFSVAMALQSFTTTHQFHREARAALAKAEMQIEVSRQGGFALWLAGGVIMRGWALSELGQADLGREEMRRGIDDWRATGAELPVGYYLSLLANAHGAAGEPAKGLALVRGALEESHRSGEAWWRPELLRTEAELILALPSPDEARAERLLLEALDLAARQHARSLELRAAMSLFRVCRARGRTADARIRLAEVLRRFTEGRTTVDYLEGERLLAADGKGAR